jgi:hypothetical protein
MNTLAQVLVCHPQLYSTLWFINTISTHYPAHGLGSFTSIAVASAAHPSRNWELAVPGPYIPSRYIIHPQFAEWECIEIEIACQILSLTDVSIRLEVKGKGILNSSGRRSDRRLGSLTSTLQLSGVMSPLIWTYFTFGQCASNAIKSLVPRLRSTAKSNERRCGSRCPLIISPT